MDDDLLYTNTFACETLNTLNRNIVVDENLKLKVFADRIQQKEIRTVLNVSSNQRKLLKSNLLTDPYEYKGIINEANFNNFADLYNLAKEVNRNIYTYQNYINTIGDLTALTPLTLTLPLRPAKIIKDLLKLKSNIVPTGTGIEKLLIQIATGVDERTNYTAMASALNAYVMSSKVYNRDKYWMPFYFTGNELDLNPIRQYIFADATPSMYSIYLNKPLNHVKSIRLISCELFNSINNITEKNNIITLQIKPAPNYINDGTTSNSTKLNTKYNFIMVILDVGVYTMDALIKHLEYKLNDACVSQTINKTADLFSVTWSLESGIIVIKSKNIKIVFHLKFYSELWGTGSMVTQVDNPVNATHGLVKNGSLNRELWYMLGFPWPYEIEQDNSNHYTLELTNVQNYHTHQVFKQDKLDIFDRSLDITNAFENFETLRPFKFPDVSIKCIYLIIKGLQSFNPFKPMESFNLLTDVFAKVQISQNPGEICFDSFVTNPLVFLNVIENLNILEISWVDESGTLVDFNNVDHSFTLEVIHYVTQVDANLYNTTLGNIDKKSYPEWLLGGN